MMPDINSKLALILIDHGSRLEAANRVVEAVAESLRSRGEFAMVEAAHMELAAPSLAEAFAACARHGARDIVIAPYFLGPGSHASGDIPRMAVEAAEEYPDVRWAIAEPLGYDARIADIVADRATEARKRIV